jgi:hypothetical protein
VRGKEGDMWRGGYCKKNSEKKRYEVADRKERRKKEVVKSI